jgi:hypothetical protein
LFKTIVKNLDEIEIYFQKKKINENIVLFKGTFFNGGNVDIEKTIVHKPLEIELPLNYTWVKYKIIDASDGLEIKTSLIGNKLVFEWDLFKEGEFFTFDSLIEYEASQDNSNSSDVGRSLVKKININHRITDLKKINTGYAIPRPVPFGGLILFSLILLSIVITSFYFSFGQLIFPSYEVFNEYNLETGKQFAKIQAKSENSVVLLDKDNNIVTTLQKGEITKKLGSEVQLNKERISYWQIGSIGIISITYFILWIFIVIQNTKERKLYKKLKKVAEKHDDTDLSSKRLTIKLFEFMFR